MLASLFINKKGWLLDHFSVVYRELHGHKVHTKWSMLTTQPGDM